MTIIETNQQLGRAKNAMLTFFERRLSVPKIYVNTEWSGQHIDVLAIDRDGVGDVHAAIFFVRNYFQDGLLDIVSEGKEIVKALDILANTPAQFKYIGGVDILPKGNFHQQDLAPTNPFMDRHLAPDGLGRIGLVHIEVLAGDDPYIKLIIKPERFRASVGKLADDYVAQHSADWEIRA